MSAFEERIARIDGVRLGWESHGIFSCSLDLNYGSSGQGAGGWALDAPPVAGEGWRRGTAFGMQWVQALMRAVGVDDFGEIAGRTVLALIEDDRVVGIKALPTEIGITFVFADLAAEHSA